MKRPIGYLLVISSVLAACGTGGDTTAPVDPTGGWQLVSGHFESKPLSLLATHPVTINFEDGQVGGTAACNSYGGGFSLDGDKLSVEQVAVTEMACEPREVMDLETNFLSALLAGEALSLDGENLVISGSNSELVFAPVVPPPTAQMLGTVWVLETLIDGEIASSVSGDRATLEFFSDGSFIATTGCRTASGTYTATGVAIRVPNMTMSGECPQELISQDDHVVAVIGDDYQVVIDGQSMTLTATGGQGLVYRADS